MSPQEAEWVRAINRHLLKELELLTKVLVDIHSIVSPGRDVNVRQLPELVRQLKEGSR